MKTNDMNEHFTDDSDYIGPGCTSPHDEIAVVGNQPDINIDDAFDQRSNAAIPNTKIVKETYA